MNVLKQLQNSIKGHHVLFLLAVVVAAVAIYQYSNRKSGSISGFQGELELSNKPSPQDVALAAQIENEAQAVTPAAPAGPLGTNGGFVQVDGVKTNTYGLPAGCAKQETTNPTDLLPKDVNNQFNQLNPQGNGDLEQMNLLKAGHHMGINTVGSSLRNANLQVRSEPPNPQLNVSPWLNSTISPDLMRIPFELGCGPQ